MRDEAEHKGASEAGSLGERRCRDAEGVNAYLPPTRDIRERLDTAQLLSHFHHRERAVALACGRFVPLVRRLEAKAELARVAWEAVLAGDAFRERVFELRYPERFLDEQVEEIALESTAELCALVQRQRDDYRAYLAAADELADGPSVRILEAALRDKERQAGTLGAVGELAHEHPARDERYFRSSFYWPDVIDPAFPYGEGVALQLRSAVSHLNEVWAVETAGRILHDLAEELGWEFVHEAGRWLYDESRHMLMGARRLEAWGFEPAEIPLGGYIYEAWQGEDTLYGLGMLGYFETKNIGRKRERAQAFSAMGDRTSELDMEFDWADETLHAEYGRRWLRRLLEVRGEDPDSWPAVLERCEQLVQAKVAAATAAERTRIRAAAESLIADAERRAG